MERQNKYNYLWVIQGYYGYGWEDLSEYNKKEDSYSLVKHDFREYCIADSYPKRIVNRRERNDMVEEVEVCRG